jgi:hypothetical protein
MKVENLLNDKNFVKSIMRKIPSYFFSNFSSDEIRSEVYFAIMNSSKYYDPKKGSIFNLVRYNTINLLNSKLHELIKIKENEVPIEAAYGRTYVHEDKHDELLAFFRTLPSEWLADLTEFVLGKKKKEEIAISNDPSFDRVLEKIDMMVSI